MTFAEAEWRIEQARANGGHFLRLSRLGLEKLPESLGNLRALKILDISGNRLLRLPCSLADPPDPTALHLHDNEFHQIPEWARRAVQGG
ncbi:leucine-rich repeat domain-containing protein [Actinomadura formosensis]|uniref:leucine-rich repeat domain-containing protein n=1 Tax=Actinomadura formosensis TaxID=60706 RepID=UPI001041709D|nr:leucine-rich repeat domain-containing protein [Actinomadura formosensis]